MNEKDLYTQNFYTWHEEGARQSAKAVVPLILELIEPRSVVDVGCGTGIWLSVFKELGLSDCLGIDGDYVDPALLQIPTPEFLARDLKQPLQIPRSFDLAISLEVAEHLPADRADTLIESLTQLAPVVVFSAAIPFQGGDGHLNEQWAEYWVEKFAQQGYVAIDCLRRKLWNDKSVKAWYAQNILVFVAQNRLEQYPKLAEEFSKTDLAQLSLVHPDTYLRVVTWLQHQLAETKALHIANTLKDTFKLRSLNAIVFPDWRQSLDSIYQNLGLLFQAISTHPQLGQMTVLVESSGVASSDVQAVLETAARDVFSQVQLDVNNTPIISWVGALSPEQWQVLVRCLQVRVILPQENRNAIAIVGADRLPTWSITVHRE